MQCDAPPFCFVQQKVGKTWGWLEQTTVNLNRGYTEIGWLHVVHVRTFCETSFIWIIHVAEMVQVPLNASSVHAVGRCTRTDWRSYKRTHSIATLYPEDPSMDRLIMKTQAELENAITKWQPINAGAATRIDMENTKMSSDGQVFGRVVENNDGTVLLTDNNCQCSRRLMCCAIGQQSNMYFLGPHRFCIIQFEIEELE